ncbi:MAG: inorganic diphosphatase [Gemmataceae bacterium]
MTKQEAIVEAFVEIPRGSRNKYEYDPVTKSLRLDRVLFSSVHYPCDYGFIEGTHGADGDPLDILILVEDPTFPGCRVQVRPIGVLLMKDEHGGDEKILGVPVVDPRFDPVHDLKDLSPHWLAEIENFFNTYKTLEGKPTMTHGWQDAKAAWEVIEKSRRSQ